MLEIEKTFAGKKENISSMLDFIVSFARDNNFPKTFTNQILVVGDEIFSNIVRHGYQDNGGPVYIKQVFDKENEELSLIISDEAKEFNQLSVNNDKLTENNLRIGGLGIFIVKRIMDDCSYERKDNKNILTLKKRFTEGME